MNTSAKPTLNKSKAIEEEKAKAVQQFVSGAAVATNEVVAEQPIAQKQEANAPWRGEETEQELRMTDRGMTGFISMELHYRLSFIKDKMNRDRRKSGEPKVTIGQIQAQAIEEYTSKVLKKWGYDV